MIAIIIMVIIVLYINDGYKIILYNNGNDYNHNSNDNTI